MGDRFAAFFEFLVHLYAFFGGQRIEELRDNTETAGNDRQAGTEGKDPPFLLTFLSSLLSVQNIRFCTSIHSEVSQHPVCDAFGKQRG